MFAEGGRRNFYKSLHSYVQVAGGQRHIQSEVVTDVGPVEAMVARGGGREFDDDTTPEAARCRIRCRNLCQPARYWLIDNGSDFVSGLPCRARRRGWACWP